jgi:hypothetical protein
MPAWLLMLIGWGPIVLPLARRVLFGLGFGLVTYYGVGAVWDSLSANVLSSLGGVSANIAALLSIAKVDQAIKIIISAGGIKLGFMGLNAAGNIIMPRWKFID